jgi:hypothetical protein
LPVLLLSRPPYARWVVAVIVVIVALGWDLAGRATEPFPVAASDIERGEPITDDDVTWRDLPRGSIRLPDLEGAHATTDIRAGDPITRSVTETGLTIPSGWWSVPVELPAGVPRGAPVRLTTLDGLVVDGIVAVASSEDSFGLPTAGSVAVPEDAVSAVSSAAATNSLIVAIAP